MGGLFSKKFWLEASSQVFLIFWNFRGSFLSLIFGFWKFWNCILNQNSHFWWGLFYTTFWFEASLYMFLTFWNFRGPFLSLIFSFWKFQNCILNQNSHFWGVCFIKIFIWGLLIYVFDFLELKGSFLSWCKICDIMEEESLLYYIGLYLSLLIYD